MQQFYNFLGRNRAYVTLSLALIVSLVLIALGPSDKLGLARSVTIHLLKAGHRFFSWPMGLAGLRFENQVLREQNLRLFLELMELREARLENVRLYGLLDFKTRGVAAEGFIAGRVIARDPDRIANTILIDVGRKDGVRDRMPVLTADGLVGRVLDVHEGTAVVQLLLDRNCRVSAVVQQSGRAQGIVVYENGIFYLKYVSIRFAIQEGDIVVSSGLGGIFPKGLFVGRVSELREGERGLFREIILEAGVNFANLEEVFVLKGVI